MTNKDLLKQYVNTGRRITPNQFNQLSSQDMKTYLRSRLNIYLTEPERNKIYSFEYDNFSEKQKIEYFNKQIDLSRKILPENFKYLTKENKIKAAKMMIYLLEDLEELEEIDIENFIFYMTVLKEMYKPGKGGIVFNQWWNKYKIK